MQPRGLSMLAPSIRSRLGWVVAATVIPLALLVMVNIRSQFREERVKAESATLAAARVLSERLDDYVDEVTLTLNLGARLVSPDPRRAVHNDSVLRAMKRELPDYVNSVALWTPAGANIGHSRTDSADTARFSVADRAYLVGAVRTRRLSIGEPVVSRSTGVWTLAMALPLLGRDSSVLAVLSVSTQLSGLDALLRQPAGVPPRAIVVLVSGEDVILARSPDPGPFLGVKRDTAAAIRAARLQGSGTGEFRNADGVTRLSGFVTLEGVRWIIFVSQPIEEALAGPRQVLWRDSLLAGLALLLALTVAGRLGVNLTDSLSNLAADAAALGAGVVGHRARLSGPRELQALASTFNSMAASLENRRSALEAAEERYRLMFEHNVLPMWLQDERTQRCVDVNEAALAQYGYSRDEFLELTIRELRAPDQSTTTDGVQLHRRRDGRTMSVEVASRAFDLHGVPTRLVMGIDVTERLRLEEQLRQTQKMESIGRLAGGVAHDFNNLLTAILGGAQLALRSVDDATPVADEIRMIESAARRAATLTKQLLAFARQQRANRVVVDLGEVLHSTEQLLRRIIVAGIRLRTDRAPIPWLVDVDVAQVEQVIVNLAVNASDAIGTSGDLAIEVSNESIAWPLVTKHGSLEPGDYVVLRVSDTGAGMSPEVLEHVFEPFFTTKAVGAGTGLGLATSYGIVKQSGGLLLVESEAGRGTTFRAYFPRAAPAAVLSAEVPVSRVSVAGTETVLVVEDDPMVMQVALRALNAAGYRTLSASDGVEGLAVARAFPDRIDAVLSDVMMPRMQGPQFVEELRKWRPRVRVLFASGYSQDQGLALMERGEAFLAKPYMGSTLTAALRKLLDTSKTS